MLRRKGRNGPPRFSSAERVEVESRGLSTTRRMPGDLRGHGPPPRAVVSPNSGPPYCVFTESPIMPRSSPMRKRSLNTMRPTTGASSSSEATHHSPLNDGVLRGGSLWHLMASVATTDNIRRFNHRHGTSPNGTNTLNDIPRRPYHSHTAADGEDKALHVVHSALGALNVANTCGPTSNAGVEAARSGAKSAERIARGGARRHSMRQHRLPGGTLMLTDWDAGSKDPKNTRDDRSKDSNTDASPDDRRSYESMPPAGHGAKIGFQGSRIFEEESDAGSRFSDHEEETPATNVQGGYPDAVANATELSLVHALVYTGKGRPSEHLSKSSASPLPRSQTPTHCAHLHETELTRLLRWREQSLKLQNHSLVQTLNGAPLLMNVNPLRIHHHVVCTLSDNCNRSHQCQRGRRQRRA
jgi:hypothetical protein